jgi:hypothetical protein
VTVNLRKVIAWLILALVVLFVLKSPDRAAEILRTAGGGLADAARSLGAFVGSLV